MVPHPVRAYRSILLTSEKLRMERLISGVLGPFSIRRSYLRKRSHRPVYILPNARREVSSGLRCPALRPFCLHTRGGELGHPKNAQRGQAETMLGGAALDWKLQYPSTGDTSGLG